MPPKKKARPDAKAAHDLAAPCAAVANGDANGDGTLDVLDVFALVNFLFAHGPAPLGLADVNGDTKVDINDVFFLINFLFANGGAPV